jgi:hypothetical protein
MKRNSITEIVRKAQLLSVKAERLTTSFKNSTLLKNAIPYIKYIRLINKAAVNEILRLEAADLKASEPTNVATLDMEAGSVSLLDSVKVICEEFNDKISKL